MTLKPQETQQIAEYFFGKKCLLIDPSSTTRLTIRKMLTGFKVENSDIYNAENFKVAETFIHEHKPHYIFTTYKIKEKNALDLLPLHLKIQPNRIEAGFYILSDENNISAGNALLDNDIDGLFTLPFTIDALVNSLLKSISQKLQPTPYTTSIEKGREYYFLADVSKAKVKFEEAIKLDPAPFSAYSFLGTLHRELKNIPEAKDCFKKALSFKDDHYKSLRHLAEICLELGEYEESYQLNSKILDNYPFNPERIPELTRLSITTKRYEDILNYLKIFTDLKELGNELVTKFISAGLAICGRYLFTRRDPPDQVRGLDALRQSAKLCRGKKEILKSIVKTLIEAQKADEAKKILEQYATEDTNGNDFIFMQIEILDSFSKDPLPILNLGQPLVISKYENSKLYEIMIKRSIEAKRKKAGIEGIINQAIILFPDEKEKYEKILATLDQTLT